MAVFHAEPPDDLLSAHCQPCEGLLAPLDHEHIARYRAGLTLDWDTLEDAKIRRTFTFPSFRNAVAFVNRVADVAEEEGHHPNLHVRYDTVSVDLSTHAVHGLSPNDFILARKIEDLVDDVRHA